MRTFAPLLAFLALMVALPAQVVINEFSYDDSSTDDREFVELYNAGGSAVDISNWTVSNTDSGGLAVGSPWAIPAGTMLPAGGFFVLGNTLVPNVNLVTTSGFLENSEEGIVLMDSMGVTQDAVGYELNKVTGLPTTDYEGVGVYGNFTMVESTLVSVARWTDGYDTNDNGADFGSRPWSPGASNNLPSVLPICQSFEGQGIEVSVPNFSGSFVHPTIVDPTTASASLVNTVPPSPDGGNCMVMWDPAGGGNAAYLDTQATIDFSMECYVYIHASDVGTDSHGWSIGVRGHTGTYYNIPQVGTANGNTGLAWRYYSQGPAATGGQLSILELVDEGPGGGATIIQTIPITAGTNDGWQRLQLTVTGGSIIANFGGPYGDPAGGQLILASTTYTSLGTCYMGFREVVPGTANAYPLMIDRLEISSPFSGPCFPEYQLNQAAATLTLDGVVGSAYSPAITTRCFGTSGAINFASTQVGLPWDAVISFEALVPASGGAFISGGGQIVNVNVITPAVPILWLNGGSAPNVATTAFPAPSWAAFYTAPAASGSASIQMGCLDVTLPDSFAISQGCQLDIIPASSTIIHAPADDDVIQVFLDQAPLCQANTINFYGSSYSTFFISSNGRVMFGNSTPDWSADVAQATTQGGAVGVWADYSPQNATNGLVTSVLPSGNIRVDWTAVPYFGQPATANTFGAEFDVTTGDIHLDTTSLVVDPSAQASWIGLSGGNLVTATDPGAVIFGPAPQAGVTTNGTDMIYMFGPAGTLTTGVARISFMPNGFNNYDWITL